MSFEIERKFLISGDNWRQSAVSFSTIRQAYVGADDKVSVRVRIRDNESATLTIKSRPSALRRLEFEYPVPVLEAEGLMSLREGMVVEKVRHIVPCDKLAWEIDVFSGENDGLIIAEIELPEEGHPIDLPSWIGAEITGRAQYYNSSLARRPYSSWTPSELIERLG
jgi:adenylate cyclase